MNREFGEKKNIINAEIIESSENYAEPKKTLIIGNQPVILTSGNMVSLRKARLGTLAGSQTAGWDRGGRTQRNKGRQGCEVFDCARRKDRKPET